MSTVAAISTATGEAGIGIVRITGPRSLEILNRVFVSTNGEPFQRGDHRKMKYGKILKDGVVLDEVLGVFMRAPNTYTREDVVEIYCHGGMMPLRSVLEFVLEEGADPAEPGEFTKRAFLNGRLDLAQAEAVMDVITAKSREGYRESIQQMSGSLSREVNEFREEVLSMLALIIANIDFPEDEVEEANTEQLLTKGQSLLKEMEDLLSTSRRGKLLKEGIRTVILGKPNVGKSSLLNALLRENRAIVTDIPGTTRDSIEEYITLDDVVLHVIDTAGIRETDDVVEKIGVNRAKSALSTADVVLALFDVSRPLEEEDREILELIGDRKAIFLLNKWDLPKVHSLEEYEKLLGRKDLLPLSLLEQQGVRPLEDRLKELFYQGGITAKGEVYLTNIRHVNTLRKAVDSLKQALEGLGAGVPMDCVEVDLNDTLEYLGEITGQSVGEDILDKIFSEFCIGK